VQKLVQFTTTFEFENIFGTDEDSDKI